MSYIRWFVCLLSFFHTASAFSQSQVAWLTDYQAAAKQAEKENKPLLILFTGSDWCGWCIKLEKEALDTPEFSTLAGHDFVFLKLDFPLYTKPPAPIVAQNKELQKKYEVRGFPTVLLLDSQLNIVGRTGYKPGGGREYALHLFKMMEDHGLYKRALKQSDKPQLQATEVRRLYEKALDSCQLDEAMSLAKLGQKTDDAHYFFIEEYRLLALQGSSKESYALALKSQLLNKDANNEQGTHYEIALIDFQVAYDAMDRENHTPEEITAPLTQYLGRFGNQDFKNCWQTQLLISQVFLEQERLPEALRYAQNSYETAPMRARPEIATAIQSIRSSLRH